jgi:hypothetical protein
MGTWDELRPVLRALSARLLLRNRTGSELQVETNGHLTADVFDPETGERVGGVARSQGAVLIVFRAAPGETTRVPLLIGAASNKVRLGYLIPPGEWHMEAKVRLGPYPRDSPFRRTPRLPLTVTD